MLKDTNNEENETSFAEAYRSQILNPDDDIEDDSSRNLIIISILVIIVSAFSIFGYKYLSQENQTKNNEIKELKSITPKENIVKEEPITPPESNQLNNIEELMSLEEETNTTKKEVKEEIKQVEKKKVTKKKVNDTYLEQLAELSKEIDGEK